MRYFRGWWWVKVRGLWAGFRDFDAAVEYYMDLRRAA